MIDFPIKVIFEIIVVILIVLLIIPFIGISLSFSNNNPNVIFSKLKGLCNAKNGAFSFTLDLSKYDIHFSKDGGGKYTIALYSCMDYNFKRKNKYSIVGIRNLSDCIKIGEFTCILSSIKVTGPEVKVMEYGTYIIKGGWCTYYKDDSSIEPTFNNFSLGDFCYKDKCRIDNECYGIENIQKEISGQFIYESGSNSLLIKINLVQ